MAFFISVLIADGMRRRLIQPAARSQAANSIIADSGPLLSSELHECTQTNLESDSKLDLRRILWLHHA